MNGDMTDHYGELHALLNTPTTRKLFKRIYDAAVKICEGENIAIEPEELAIDGLGRLYFELAVNDHKEELQREFFARLPEPFSVAMDDVTNAFRDHLSVEPDMWEHGYTCFLSSLIDRANSVNQSEPFPLIRFSRNSLGPGDNLSNAEEIISLCAGKHAADYETIQPETTVWRSGQLVLEIVGILPRQFQMEIFGILSWIGASKIAFQNIEKLIREIVDSANHSYELLYLNSRNCGQAVLRKEDVSLWIAFLKESLDAALMQKNRAKGPTIFPRLRNAILLLAQADKQQNGAIQLSLCMAAIDALVGDKPKDPGTGERRQILDTNVAALLEPDPKKRNKASDFVRTLYEKRSDTIHGLSLDSGTWACEARLLAGGVLKSVLDRVSFARRSKQLENPITLKKELQNAFVHQRRVNGVVDIKNVKKLWHR